MEHDQVFERIESEANLMKEKIQQFLCNQKLQEKCFKDYENQIVNLIDQLDAIQASKQSARGKRKAQVCELQKLLNQLDNSLGSPNASIKEQLYKLTQENQNLQEANKNLVEKLRNIEDLVRSFDQSYRNLVHKQFSN